MKTLLISCLLLVCIGFTQIVYGFKTRKEAQKYLIRYGITHDEMDDNELLATVKQYRDMAILNTELFGDRVERLLEGLDLKLKGMGVDEQHRRDRLLQDIKRGLQQLEVQGLLTRDHVHEHLMDSNNRIAVSSSHFLTPEQWQQVVTDIEEMVSPPSTWSKWFGSSSSPIRIGDKDPYKTWLDQTTLAFTSWLGPKKQKTLRMALDKAMKRQELGSKEWWKLLLNELHGFSEDELETTIDQLRMQVLGFKVFTHDYLGLPSPPVYQDEQSKWMDQGWWKRLWITLTRPIHALFDTFASFRQHLNDQAHVFLTQKKKQTLQIQDDWSKSIQNAKQSFATYWLEREYEAYRRIGYTEGEIAWIHSYLNRALHSSSPHSFNQIIADVRKHLNSLRRQTKAQVELHVLKLDRLLQAWKISIMGGGHSEL